MPLDMVKVNADFMKVRNERAESIVIRRGNDSLAAQTVRVEKGLQYGLLVRSLNGKEYRAQAVVLGDTDLDVAVEDRFNDANGILFMIIFVNPNREACTVAEAAIVE